MIKAAQKMGISLQEIKRAFATLPDNRTPTTADWEILSTYWRDELNARRTSARTGVVNRNVVSDYVSWRIN